MDNENLQIEEVLTRGVNEVIDKKDLEEKLHSGVKLRVKLGIDPTSPNIHIGRAVALWKLRQFQDLGHQVVFIVGDFTGQVGDTSDKNTERPMLTEESIKNNLKTYLKQAYKILDRNKTEIAYNSKWLRKLGFMEICKMADLFSLNEFASRENIAKRYTEGKRVSLRELLYPIMQGYDSVAVKADVELGGTDQRFNLLAGRTIQPLYGQTSQNILMMDIIEGLDGRKMSSSWGNTINILDEPKDMYGKVMSLRDELIAKYFMVTTRMPITEITEFLKQHEHPRTQKMRLAFEITKLYHGEEKAMKAEKAFVKQFSEKKLPDEIPARKLLPGSYKLVDVLLETGLATSKNEARRLVEQNGVKIDQKTPESDTLIIKDVNGIVIQVGKRKFIKIL
ncbi:MAG TPA: tyrosine--tRNA ligase [Patescibacteria group bacterium]|nr:tyrosine--tRNA ligase [Patescibacteria group bacterium]